MIGRWLEGVVFAALAIVLHLAVVRVQSDETGRPEGGAAGGSSVALAGATTELSAMIAEWDVAPKLVQSIEEIAPDRPTQLDDFIAEEMTSPKIALPMDAPRHPQTSQVVKPPIDAPVTPPPVPKPALLTPPSAEAPVMTTPTASRAGLSVPAAATTPTAHRLTARQIPPDTIASPDINVAENAPARAPTPQKKPNLPKRAGVTAAQAKPVSPARPRFAAAPLVDQRAPTKAVEIGSAAGSGSAAAPAQVAAGGRAGVGDSEALGPTGPNAAETAGLEHIWGSEIRKSVERKKRYPRSSRRSGATQIAMTVSRNGGLLAASIQRGSGHTALDKAAMKAVKAAAPYAPAPGGLNGDHFTFVLQILFKR